jgi:hypothetical protein
MDDDDKVNAGIENSLTYDDPPTVQEELKNFLDPLPNSIDRKFIYKNIINYIKYIKYIK